MQGYSALWLPGTDHAFAHQIYDTLRANKVRTVLDDRNEKIGYKIREARQVDRVPYMVIVGANEIETGTVSVRDRDTDQTTNMTLEAFVELLNGKIANRE